MKGTLLLVAGFCLFATVQVALLMQFAQATRQEAPPAGGGIPRTSALQQHGSPAPYNTPPGAAAATPQSAHAASALPAAPAAGAAPKKNKTVLGHLDFSSGGLSVKKIGRTALTSGR